MRTFAILALALMTTACNGEPETSIRTIHIPADSNCEFEYWKQDAAVHTASTLYVDTDRFTSVPLGMMTHVGVQLSNLYGCNSLTANEFILRVNDYGPTSDWVEQLPVESYTHLKRGDIIIATANADVNVVRNDIGEVMSSSLSFHFQDVDIDLAATDIVELSLLPEFTRDMTEERTLTMELSGGWTDLLTGVNIDANSFNASDMSTLTVHDLP